MLNIQHERQLIKEFIDGQCQSGQVLIEAYYHKLLGAALKTLNNIDDAKDVVQNVCCKVFVEGKINKFRGEARLGSWLYRITINECHALIEKKQKNHEKSYHEMETNDLEFPDNYRPNPEEHYVQSYIKSNMEAAINNLDEIYQKSIRTIYYTETSYKEAAKQLEVPMHTLGVRVMRSKEKLSMQLEQLNWLYYNGDHKWYQNLVMA